MVWNIFGVNRSVFAYWVLGLCNNYGYVVMLSAAHDILTKNSKDDFHHEESLHVDRHCNELSTGVILLADIIPSLIVKLIAPFLPLWMNIRMITIIFTSLLGFVCVGMANSLTVAVIGVIFTSISGGLGESSLLSYTVSYKNKSIISSWSSGTGGAGFFGSLTYAGLLLIGVKPTYTIYIMLLVPLCMAISFWLILENPIETKITVQNSISQSVSVDMSSNNNESNNFWHKIETIPYALRYMLPLMLVYYFEYLINQGLFELALVEDSYLKMSTQYHWFQVCYQSGVFVSRSSISIIQINKLWFLSLLQGINVVYFVFEAIYKFTSNVLVICIIILWEGILGGLAYVNTFNKIQQEVAAEKKVTVTGITSIADSAGISLSGFSAIPLHNKICSLPKF